MNIETLKQEIEKMLIKAKEEANDKVKIMKTGDYDRGWWTYLSSFNMIFRK